MMKYKKNGKWNGFDLNWFTSNEESKNMNPQ